MFHWKPNETCLYTELSKHFINELCQIILDYIQPIGEQLQDRLTISLQSRYETNMHGNIRHARSMYPEIDQSVSRWINKNRFHLLEDVAKACRKEEYYEACKIMTELNISPPIPEQNRDRFITQWIACRWLFLEQGLYVFNPVIHGGRDEWHKGPEQCAGEEYCSWCNRSNLVVVRIHSPASTEFHYCILPESFPEVDEPCITNQYFDFQSSSCITDKHRASLYRSFNTFLVEAKQKDSVEKGLT